MLLFLVFVTTMRSVVNRTNRIKQTVCMYVCMYAVVVVVVAAAAAAATGVIIVIDGRFVVAL